MDPSKMTTAELLQLYRGVDMRPMEERDYWAFAGAGRHARIGSTDDMVIVEDMSPQDGAMSGIQFLPTEDIYPSVMLEIRFVVC